MVKKTVKLDLDKKDGIPITVLGHPLMITDVVVARLFDYRSPLAVLIECDPPINGTTAFPVYLPAKEYSKDKFLKEAAKKAEEWIRRDIKERKRREKEILEQKHLEQLVQRIRSRVFQK